MDNSIIIKEVNIDEIVKVNSSIAEFNTPYSRDHFENRLEHKTKLMIVAYFNDVPAWYIIGYDRDSDDSFYCWMAGVNPKYRRKWILKELMNYQENWAKEKNYKKIKIKTRNDKRSMLAYLVKYGFFFTWVKQYSDIKDSRIQLEKFL